MNRQDIEIEVVIRETKKQTLMLVINEIRTSIEYNLDQASKYDNEQHDEVDRNLSLIYWARRHALFELKKTIQSWIKDLK